MMWEAQVEGEARAQADGTLKVTWRMTPETPPTYRISSRNACQDASSVWTYQVPALFVKEAILKDGVFESSSRLLRLGPARAVGCT